MSKIKEYLKAHRAIRVFGGIGIVVIILLFVASTILQKEIGNLWDSLMHPNETHIEMDDTPKSETPSTQPDMGGFNSESVIPIDTRKADLRIFLEDPIAYWDDLSGTRRVLPEPVDTRKSCIVSLVNTTYNILYDNFEFSLVDSGAGNESQIVFRDVPAGNYKIMMDIEGYLPVEAVATLDPKDINDYVTEIPEYWGLGYRLVRLNADSVKPFRIQLFDSDFFPLANAYYCISLERNPTHMYYDSHAEGGTTDHLGFIPFDFFTSLDSGFVITLLDSNGIAMGSSAFTLINYNDPVKIAFVSEGGRQLVVDEFDLSFSDSSGFIIDVGYGEYSLGDTINDTIIHDVTLLFNANLDNHHVLFQKPSGLGIPIINLQGNSMSIRVTSGTYLISLFCGSEHEPGNPNQIEVARKLIVISDSGTYEIEF